MMRDDTVDDIWSTGYIYFRRANSKGGRFNDRLMSLEVWSVASVRYLDCHAVKSLITTFDFHSGNMQRASLAGSQLCSR